MEISNGAIVINSHKILLDMPLLEAEFKLHNYILEKRVIKKLNITKLKCAVDFYTVKVICDLYFIDNNFKFATLCINRDAYWVEENFQLFSRYTLLLCDKIKEGLTKDYDLIYKTDENSLIFQSKNLDIIISSNTYTKDFIVLIQRAVTARKSI